MIAARSGLFVTLEGLSGVGKTTLAPMLADALGAKEMPAVPPVYRGTRASFDDLSLIEARYLYFLSAICRASVEVETELGRGTSVVVESFLARTVAFHRGMGAEVAVDLSATVVAPRVRRPTRRGPRPVPLTARAGRAPPTRRPALAHHRVDPPEQLWSAVVAHAQESRTG